MASYVTALLLNLDASANDIPPLAVRPRVAVAVDVLVLLPETRSIDQYRGRGKCETPTRRRAVTYEAMAPPSCSTLLGIDQWGGVGMTSLPPFQSIVIVVLWYHAPYPLGYAKVGGPDVPPPPPPPPQRRRRIYVPVLIGGTGAPWG